MNVKTVVCLSALSMGLAAGIAFLLPLPSRETTARLQSSPVRSRAPSRLALRGSRYLQIATFSNAAEAIAQAKSFRRQSFEAQVFWTSFGNYVVTLGPFATEHARQLERSRFLQTFDGAEALAQPGQIYDLHIWPELAQTF
jgi:hypothetical protein